MATIPPLKKENLTYPEWDQQTPIEKNKHHFIFDLFCRHGGTVAHFARDISGIHKGDVFLGVTLIYEPYSKRTIVSVATAHLWIYRRDLKEKYIKDYRIKQLDAIDDEDFLEQYKQKKRIMQKIRDKLEDKLDADEINGTQTKDYVTAHNGLQDSQVKDKGDDVKKSKVEFEGKLDAEAEVKTDFQRDMDEFQEKILSGKLSERINKKLGKED
ncbi:hypothetical protein [Methanobrevibacter sp.]|uniref:hypothetical protein n=1 Tax=Methanobrevibacter sp. TaxID=66852 RepID=UPI00388FFD13